MNRSPQLNKQQPASFYIALAGCCLLSWQEKAPLLLDLAGGRCWRGDEWKPHQVYLVLAEELLGCEGVRALSFFDTLLLITLLN